jgi:ATP-binding cassette subfamily B protein
VERNAFARAWSYLLEYSSFATWSAMLAAVGTSLVYVALLAVLGLFADLIVYEGRVSHYAELNYRQRQNFYEAWEKKLSAEERLAWVQRAAPPEFALAKLAGVDRDLSASEWEARWRGYVKFVLAKQVNQTASDTFQPDLTRDFGALGLVVRTHQHWAGGIIGLFVAWNSWSWQPVFGSTASLSYLGGLLLFTLALALVRGLFKAVMFGYAAEASVEVATRLRRSLYHHTFRLGNQALRSSGAIETNALFGRHIDNIHEALFVWLTTVVREPVKFALLLTFALMVHFWLSLLCLLAAAVVWIIGGQIAAYYRRHGRLAAHRATFLSGLMQESLRLVQLVKSYTMELFNQSRIERHLTEHSKALATRLRGDTSPKPVLVVFGTVAAGIVLYIIGLIVLSDGVSVASMILLVTALASLFEPLRNRFAAQRLLRKGTESAEKVFEYLDRKPDVDQATGADYLPRMATALELSDVTVREPGSSRFLLQGINLKLQAGEKIAVCGADDAEKHALAYLVPRFLDPTSGEVRIDGKGLRWVTLESLRVQVGVVLQQNLVFNDSVANNIGCGDTNYTLPQIIEAAKLAHAHHFIMKLPHGYETPIGEMGHQLSKSEQFRIGLARAILRDPALMVVEEPAEALDEDTHALLNDTFSRILSERTCIFLPNRLSTVRSCDRVYLLNQGRIQAEGEHDMLMKSNELYRHLTYMRYNEFAQS